MELASEVRVSAADAAVRAVPRALFVNDHRPMVGSDSNPPPATVVAMLEALAPDATSKVLQVGAGSGFATAALARMSGSVDAVERVEPLAKVVRERLDALELSNVRVHVADGSHGLPGRGPYDAILVTASAVAVGPALIEQLAPGGRIVATYGDRNGDRELVRHTKDDRGVVLREDLGRVRLRRDVGDALESLGVVSSEVLDQARRAAARTQRPLQDVIAEHANIEEGDLYRAMARVRGLAHISVAELLEVLDPSVAEQVPRAYLDHHRMVPVGHRGEELLVATTNSHALGDEIAAAFPGEQLRLCLVSPNGFRRIWSSIDLRQATRDGDVVPSQSAAKEELLDGEFDRLESYASSVFEALLLDAIGERASDIHLERYGERVRVRLRVDGELRDQGQYTLTPAELDALINVIKVRAQLDIAERRLPQGGRIRLRAGEQRFDLRVQTQPALHGEHVVIRLLPQKTRTISIEDLGFPADIAAQYRRLLDSPSGMVLVVGPTGSGKSTTLYAGLQNLADDARRKVITVEDPIEYSIDGVQQTQVKPGIGFSFADAMRAFVREDPDVILVGEIRDSETALEAIRASQTGHLVLSTLHCNDAVDAVQRLYDLGMHPNSIASELLAVISQRLARRICPRCRKPDAPDPELLAELFPVGAPDDFRCFIGEGCPSCGGHGTRGRVATVEFLRVNADIRRSVSRQLALDDLREQARAAGMHTLRTSLLRQIDEGLVPLSEARRLLHADEMAGEAVSSDAEGGRSPAG